MIKFLLLIQITTILMVPELLLLFYLAQRTGKFTTIATLLAASMVGLFLATNSIAVLMRKIRKKLNNGTSAINDMGSLILLFIAAYFLVTPGFIGFVIGIAIYYTPLRLAIERLLQNTRGSDLLTLYYYMKIDT